ncbi:MAG TPA: TldD/PmbA family protein [Haliangiales bacterium]|nr:TldD/PmbA family protein [Haliangiales bacterium]
MPLSRRQFLGSAGALALVSAAARSRLASARGLLVEPVLDDIVRRALDAAKKAGATYADVRLVRRRSETIATREDRVERVDATESYGVGVRVLAAGAWGFAATSRVEPREAERVARRAVDTAKANARILRTPVTLAPNPARVDVWQTPLVKDPFKISVEDKVELLLALNAEVLKVKGVKFVSSGVTCLGEWKLLATSEGAHIEQDITRIGPTLQATAVGVTSGEFESRAHQLAPAQAGWEYIEESSLRADARRIGEEAVEKLSATGVEPGKRDLILDPGNLYLTIHESIGHATELDRALGYEANFAGTSFATPDMLGKLMYGSEIVTVFADKTTPRGLATCGYDDDGVKTQKWNLIENGKLVGYQTTRDQAAFLGEKASRGTCYGQDFASFPFQRMPNVSLAPGKDDRGAKDLIAATDDGVLIQGNGSWSIDHQRKNFQFGGQMFFEVRKGKIARALRDVAYQAQTLDFWRSCDLLGGPSSWELHGALGDGKGEPSQSNAVSHGCPPARFRGVNILNTNQRKRA